MVFGWFLELGACALRDWDARESEIQPFRACESGSFDPQLLG